jgi:hypothetical protein
MDELLIDIVTVIFDQGDTYAPYSFICPPLVSPDSSGGGAGGAGACRDWGAAFTEAALDACNLPGEDRGVAFALVTREVGWRRRRRRQIMQRVTTPLTCTFVPTQQGSLDTDVLQAYKEGTRWGRTHVCILPAHIAQYGTHGIQGLERLNAPPRLTHYDPAARTLQLAMRLKHTPAAPCAMLPAPMAAPSHPQEPNSVSESGAGRSAGRSYSKGPTNMYVAMHDMVDQFFAQKEDGTYIR